MNLYTGNYVICLLLSICVLFLTRRKDQKDPMLQMWLQDLDNVNFDPIEHEDESEGEEMAIDRSNSVENSKQQENSDSEKKPEIETETEENKTEIDVGDSTDNNYNKVRGGAGNQHRDSEGRRTR